METVTKCVKHLSYANRNNYWHLYLLSLYARNYAGTKEKLINFLKLRKVNEKKIIIDETNNLIL